MEIKYNNKRYNERTLKIKTNMGKLKTELTEKELPTEKENTELIEKHLIGGTPFTAIRVDDKWFLALGKYRLTEPLESLEECIEQSKADNWTRIMQVINVMIENQPKLNNN